MKNVYFHWLLLMLLLYVNQLEYPVGFLISLRPSPTQFKCKEVEAMCNYYYYFFFFEVDRLSEATKEANKLSQLGQGLPAWLCQC